MKEGDSVKRTCNYVEDYNLSVEFINDLFHLLNNCIENDVDTASFEIDLSSKHAVKVDITFTPIIKGGNT